VRIARRRTLSLTIFVIVWCSLVAISVSSLVCIDLINSDFFNILDDLSPDKLFWVVFRNLVESPCCFEGCLKLLALLNSVESCCKFVKNALSLFTEILRTPAHGLL